MREEDAKLGIIWKDEEIAEQADHMSQEDIIKAIKEFNNS